MSDSWGDVDGKWITMPTPDAAMNIAQLPGRGVLGEMALHHVGVAVHDLDAAVARFGELLGLHDWMLSTISADTEFRCAEEISGARTAFAQMGPINLELVQPTEGSWTPREFLDTRGEGVYHLGIRVPDVGAAITRAEGVGLRVATVGRHAEADGPLWAYMENDDSHGVSLELVGPRFHTDMAVEIHRVQ